MILTTRFHWENLSKMDSVLFSVNRHYMVHPIVLSILCATIVIIKKTEDDNAFEELKM